MADEPQTFGKYVSQTRKQLGLSQKQLAERIEREEGGPISAQYLNDIEHDRRSPSSDHMMQEFARVQAQVMPKQEELDKKTAEHKLKYPILFKVDAQKIAETSDKDLDALLDGPIGVVLDNIAIPSCVNA